MGKYCCLLLWLLWLLWRRWLQVFLPLLSRSASSSTLEWQEEGRRGSDGCNCQSSWCRRSSEREENGTGGCFLLLVSTYVWYGLWSVSREERRRARGYGSSRALRPMGKSFPLIAPFTDFQFLVFVKSKATCSVGERGRVLSGLSLVTCPPPIQP